MRLRPKQQSCALPTVYYDHPVLPLANLEKRKEILQNSRSLAEVEADELRKLVQLFADLEPYEPFKELGGYLTRDDDFPKFVRDLVTDVTGHSWLDEWPYDCLDWECAIAQVRAECTEIEFNGYTYWLKVGERRFGPEAP